MTQISASSVRLWRESLGEYTSSLASRDRLYRPPSSGNYGICIYSRQLAQCPSTKCIWISCLDLITWFCKQGTSAWKKRKVKENCNIDKVHVGWWMLFFLYVVFDVDRLTRARNLTHFKTPIICKNEVLSYYLLKGFIFKVSKKLKFHF